MKNCLSFESLAERHQLATMVYMIPHQIVDAYIDTIDKHEADANNANNANNRHE